MQSINQIRLFTSKSKNVVHGNVIGNERFYSFISYAELLLVWFASFFSIKCTDATGKFGSKTNRNKLTVFLEINGRKVICIINQCWSSEREIQNSTDSHLYYTCRIIRRPVSLCSFEQRKMPLLSGCCMKCARQINTFTMYQNAPKCRLK